MVIPVMLPGHERDFGGQVTVATAPDENLRSQITVLATTFRVGGPSGLPYSMSNSGLHGHPVCVCVCVCVWVCVCERERERERDLCPRSS